MGGQADQRQKAFLEEVRPHVIENLICGHTESIQKKYEWFASYFNEIAAEFGADEVAT